MSILAAGQREKVSKIPALRGSILSADNFPLVTNKAAYLLFVNPQKINQDLDTNLKKLVPFLIGKDATDAALLKELETKKTGELEEMLNVVSDSYDGQVDTAIKSMTSMLGPFMIAVMGLIIGLVALSIFMPLLELNNLASTG